MLTTILIILGTIAAIVLWPLTLLTLSAALTTIPMTLFVAFWSAGIMWVVGQTFLGTWLVEGAAQLGLTLQANQLWKLAAFLAFVGGFFKANFAHTHEKKQNVEKSVLKTFGLEKHAK